MFGPAETSPTTCPPRATRRTPSCPRPSCSTSPAPGSAVAPRSAHRSPFRCTTAWASSTTSGSTSQDEIDEFVAGFTSAASIDAALQLGAATASTSTCPSAEFQRLAARLRDVDRRRRRRSEPWRRSCATSASSTASVFGEPEDVAIDGGVIGRAIAGPDADIVDGAGGYLIPGLIDCHIHLCGPDTLRSAGRLGVTTALDMSSPAPLVDGAARAAAGSPTSAAR